MKARPVDQATAYLRLSNWIYEHLGDRWCGSAVPPGDHRNLPFGHKMVAYVFDDGGWLHIGWRDEMMANRITAADARKVAVFILWDWWALGTWFGLKRKLWYWALHRKVGSYRRG
jgi:hypothetical protein